MTIRLKDLLNLPDAVINEFEQRSDMKAQAMAHNIVNKLTGSNYPVNPCQFNPYLQSNNGERRFTQNINEILGDADEQ